MRPAIHFSCERIANRVVRGVMKMRSDVCSPIAVVLENQDKEQLLRLMVELIREDKELRRAILEVVWSCPNIVLQV